MKPSDVGQQIHSFKKGLYKWDLVRFNHTNQKIIMTNIRDELFQSLADCENGQENQNSSMPFLIVLFVNLLKNN